MCNFNLIYFLLFIININGSHCQISDKRLCADENCSEPVSLAKTLMRYTALHPMLLSFPANLDIKIYSKAAGSMTNLWGAEIDGKRGYIPKNMVREMKVLKKATHLVDTELSELPKVPVKIDQTIVKPDKVKEPFEVVDGTTIMLNGEGSISPSTTESPTLSTVPPDELIKTNAQEQPLESKQPDAKKDSTIGNVFSKVSQWLSDDKAESDEKNDAENVKKENHNFKTRSLKVSAEETSQINEQPNVEKTVEEIKTDNVQPVTTSPEVSEKGDEKVLIETQTEPDIVDENALPIEIDDAVTPNPVEIETKQDLEKSDAVPQKPSEPNIKEEIEEGNTEKLIPVNSEIKQGVQESEALASNVTEKGIKQDNLDTTAFPDVKEEIKETSSPLTVAESEKNQEGVVKDPKVVENEPSDSDNPLSSGEEVKQEKIETTAPPDIMKEPVEPVTITPVLEIKEESIASTKEELESINSEPKDEKHTIISEQIFENQNLPSSPLVNFENNNEELNATNEDEEKIQSETINNVPNKLSENFEEKNPEVNTNTEDISHLPTPPPLFGQMYQKIEDVKNQYEEIIKEVGHEEITKEKVEYTETVKEEIGYEEIASEEVKYDEIVKDETKHEELVTEEKEITEETKHEEPKSEEETNFFASLLSFFTSDVKNEETSLESSNKNQNFQYEKNYCTSEDNICNTRDSSLTNEIFFDINSDMFMYLLATGISCVIFLFAYLAIEKNRREAPLIARINKLEKEFIVVSKENELLKEQGPQVSQIELSNIPNEEFEEIKKRLLEADMERENLEMKLESMEKELEAKHALELQVESLEKELETSTEIGMELNRIISEMLNPTKGGEKLKENVDQLQRQLIEQKVTINSISASLSEKEAENAELIMEVEANKKKANNLQSKLDEMVQKILSIEKERDNERSVLKNEIQVYERQSKELIMVNSQLNKEIQTLTSKLTEMTKEFHLKSMELKTLKESLNKSEIFKGSEDKLNAIFDVVGMKAQFEQLKVDNEQYAIELQEIQVEKSENEKNYQKILEEIEVLRRKYEDADKEKVETTLKLEILNSYFKKRENELQEEVLKYKSIWDAKEGEATSTTERIKLLQEEIENYKSQNETLKQEILSQEIDLKSQISMLEKKVHENWVQARQTERKLEDARQEAAQLRNRLTLRERAITEERVQNRLQSPVEQNGDLTFSPHPLESPASPPLLYAARDHMTKSPPIPGLPPFLPPPPGAPFIPPPPIPGMPMPFMPPPPTMFPGDHRPPPLGRMSSPLLNSRYSPDTSAFSPYDRHSPSPPYDSEYGASPPPTRAYSPPYNSRDDRRDFKRPPPPQHGRSNGRNIKGSVVSSGSGSNDSIDKIKRNQSKMV